MSESVYRVEGDYAREWFKDAIARRDKRLAVSDDCLELSEVLNVDNCGFYTKSRKQRPAGASVCEGYSRWRTTSTDRNEISERRRLRVAGAISDCIGLSVRQ